MNTSEQTGGPAFPNVAGRYQASACGMTLRDYFAAKAMQGAISGMATRAESLIYSECASLSYEMADAMLKARGQ